MPASVPAPPQVSINADVVSLPVPNLRRQGALLLALAKSNDVDDGELTGAVQRITQTATDGLGLARSSVWFFDDAGDHLVCHDLCEKGAHSSGVSLPASAYPRYFAALAEDRTIAADDAHHHPATSEFRDGYLVPLGIRSMLEAPIRRGGRVIGVLCNEHVGDARRFSAEDEQFAASLADLVARAMDARDRRAAEEALRAANLELERRREHLEELVEARTRELAARNAENQDLIRRLRAAVDQLSSPVLELWDDVLALPVIGVVDSERAAALVERLLDEVARTGARFVVVDLTGVDVVDTGTADRLVKLAQAVQLLGARCVLTGLRPLVAQTLVDLGAEFGNLATLRNLKQGLLYAMEHQRRDRATAREVAGAPAKARA